MLIACMELEAKTHLCQLRHALRKSLLIFECVDEVTRFCLIKGIMKLDALPEHTHDDTLNNASTASFIPS
ncbi:hypothetical protein ACSVDA_18475 [Cytobacillus sp. Hm23]